MDDTLPDFLSVQRAMPRTVIFALVKRIIFELLIAEIDNALPT
ncbi:hypothetical protein [Aliiroseovarius crassostreae]|nr:hypothetical protein [Aliiroseovarius crassostreae]